MRRNPGSIRLRKTPRRRQQRRNASPPKKPGGKKNRRRARLPFWILGNVLLLSTILAQGIYFYGSELARLSPALKPALAGVCHVLGCTLTPPQDINLIDLVEARVAPHPKFNKALRIRATLVNRASFSQAF